MWRLDDNGGRPHPAVGAVVAIATTRDSPAAQLARLIARGAREYHKDADIEAVFTDDPWELSFCLGRLLCPRAAVVCIDDEFHPESPVISHELVRASHFGDTRSVAILCERSRQVQSRCEKHAMTDATDRKRLRVVGPEYNMDSHSKWRLGKGCAHCQCVDIEHRREPRYAPRQERRTPVAR